MNEDKKNLRKNLKLSSLRVKKKRYESTSTIKNKMKEKNSFYLLKNFSNESNYKIEQTVSINLFPEIDKKQTTPTLDQRKEDVLYLDKHPKSRFFHICSNSLNYLKNKMQQNLLYSSQEISDNHEITHCKTGKIENHLKIFDEDHEAFCFEHISNNNSKLDKLLNLLVLFHSVSVNEGGNY